MNKRAFTLIELMIVVAIMGITMHAIFPSFQAMIIAGRQNQSLIEEARSLTVVYAAIKAELAKCTTIVDCDFDRVLFNDDHVIRFARNGKKVTVGNKEYILGGKARIKDLLAVSSSSFSTEVQLGKDIVTVLWRIGAENVR